MQPGPILPHKSKQKKFIVLGIIVVIVVGLLLLIFRNSDTVQNSTENGSETQPVLADAINGVKVEPKIAEQRPLAIIIENHPDSRPQSGLSRADIVYETLAEGGITRYLVLFQTQPADNIGPVRSLRIYFGEIAEQWRAILVHVGGNSEALDRLRRGVYKNVSDIDEYFNGDYFRRASNRPAPHNVYTSIETLGKLVAEKKYSTQASHSLWKFKDDAAAAQPQAANLTIPFSTPQFTANFRYDPADNVYLRSLASKADKDTNNQQQLRAKTIVVQFVTETVFPTDAIGTISLKLTGSGKALVFQDGLVTNATWRQENGFTRYYDSANNEIAFNRGALWVAIVPTTLEQAVTWQAAPAQ